MNELFKVGLFAEASTLPKDNGCIPDGTIICRTTKHTLSVRYGAKDLICGWIATAQRFIRLDAFQFSNQRTMLFVYLLLYFMPSIIYHLLLFYAF
jgi:hypothetical protein